MDKWRRGRNWLLFAVRYLVLTVFVGAMLLPIYEMVITSLRPFGELFRSPPRWFPTTWRFYNYVEVLFGPFRFGQAYLNSIIIALSVAGFSVVFGFFAAYALSRFRFRLAPLLLFAILATQMFTPVILIVPIHQIMQRLGLLNTHIAVVLAQSALTIPIATWLLYGYLASIPKELEEAALTDGCSRLTSLWHVVLPLAAPGLAMSGIFTFISGWNELLFPSILLTAWELQPIPVALSRFVGQNIVQWHLIMAAGVLAIVPMSILFNLVQGAFVKGITAGAVKE